MLPPLAQRIADAPRDKLLWGLIGFLVVGQIVAFWMLCQYQVRKAEVRHATLQVERVALADCMQYIPKATHSSCRTRMAAQQEQASTPAAAQTAMSTSASAVFTIR
jgi:hypothetical protein